MLWKELGCGVNQAFEKKKQKFWNHIVEHKRVTSDLRGEIFDLKKELVNLHDNQVGTLRRVVDLEKKNVELDHHAEEVQRISRALEDKNSVLENKNVELEAKMSSVWAEADAWVFELQGRLARLEGEVEGRIDKEVYDQFLSVLSGTMDAHPDLDYSFLP